MPRQLEQPANTSISKDPLRSSPQGSVTKNNLDSRGTVMSFFQASHLIQLFLCHVIFSYSFQVWFSVFVNFCLAVVDALKTLQQKIQQLELERKQAERSYRQFSHQSQKYQQVSASYVVPGQPSASQPERDNSSRKGKWCARRGHTLCITQVFSFLTFFKKLHCICVYANRAGLEAAVCRGSVQDSWEAAELHEENGWKCQEGEEHSHRESGSSKGNKLKQQKYEQLLIQN